MDHSVSDHKATYVCVKTNLNLNCAYKRKVWLYKNADFDRLNSLITNTDWETLIMRTDNVHNATVNFSHTFFSHIRESIPEKLITIRPKDKPWFDSALRKEIGLRNRLRKIAMKSNNALDMQKFKKSRNKVNNMKSMPLIITIIIWSSAY